MKVELKTGKWGWRYVHVDGSAEPWAEIHWDSHGPRGRTWYWLDPVAHRPVMVPDGPRNEKHGERRAEIRTQYPAGYFLLPGDPGAHKSTDERLLKVSEHLIAQGMIQNPRVTRAALRKKEEARKRKLAQARERERERFENRAAACIELLMISKNDQQTVVAKIVEAMKWAQTR